MFLSPGIDLMDMASDVLQPEGDDTARQSWNMRKIITKYQETFSVIEKVNARTLSLCCRMCVCLVCINTKYVTFKFLHEEKHYPDV